jgi:hypothetical protein
MSFTPTESGWAWRLSKARGAARPVMPDQCDKSPFGVRLISLEFKGTFWRLSRSLEEC